MGSYYTYSIPGKTAALVPEFAVEDLPSAELNLGSCTCSEGPALGQNTLMMNQKQFQIGCDKLQTIENRYDES